MIRKTAIVLMMALIVGGSCVFAGPAQDILRGLAEEARSERVVSGLTTVAIGVAIGIGGSLLLADVGWGTYAAIAGGLIALPGIVTLVLPSDAELACARSCDSEADAALALENMAATARLARYVSGVVNIAAGTASLLFPYSYVTRYDYVYSAVMSYGMAVIDFLFPSKEERAYNQYKLAVGTG